MISNKQKLEELLEEYRQEQIQAETLKFRLETLNDLLDIHKSALRKCERREKSQKKTYMFVGLVNAVPLALGIITSSIFSMGISGGLFLFGGSMFALSAIAQRRLNKKIQKIQKRQAQMVNYRDYLENRLLHIEEKIKTLQVMIEKQGTENISTEEVVKQLYEHKKSFEKAENMIKDIQEFVQNYSFDLIEK